MAINVFVRLAQSGDRAAMRSLLTTSVNGSSPLDDLITDYGATVHSFSVQDLLEKIQSGQSKVAVALEEPARTVLRGWSIFDHGDGLSVYLRGVSIPDAWEHAYIVTDKNLSLADRLSVVNQIAKTAAGTVPGTTYIWADVKTPGNLDTALAQLYSSFPVISHGIVCNRYYATAAAVGTHG